VGDNTIAYSSFSKSASSTTSFVVIANSPEGTGIEAYTERLCTIGDPSFVGKIVASQPATDANQYYKVENFTLGDGATYFTAAKQSPLKGIRVLNNVLYYGGLDTVYQHSASDIASGANPTELSRTGGALSQKAFCVVENDIWFYSPDNTIRSLGSERNLGDNPRTKALTEVIKRNMNLLDPVQDNPVMVYYNRLVKLHLKTKNSPTNNYTIIFDYNTGGFSIDVGRAVACSCTWDGNLVFTEDSSSNTYYDEQGYSANNSSLVVQANTPFDDDNRPDLYKRARYIVFSGQQSYTQPITVKLYRGGDYTVFTTYTIPSPQARGIAVSNTVPDSGTFGGQEIGDGQFGGNDANSGSQSIKTYLTRGYKIGISQKSNMFAIGIEASVNGGKILCEQLELMVVDETQEYKRTNI
jgi:hypothetical protein